MKGKANKGKTGYIKTTDLVDYVESEVPEIAEKHFKRKQYPTTTISGQGFPIGKSGLCREYKDELCLKYRDSTVS